MNQEYLEKLAKLAIRKGVNLQKGQKIFIRSAIEPEMAKLARACAKEAWKAGASEVYMDWNDPQSERLLYQNADEKTLSTAPIWRGVMLEEGAKMDACFLMIDGEDPDNYQGIDPSLLFLRRQGLEKITKKYRQGMDNGTLAWAIVAAPSEGWAKKVYPDLDAKEAIERLWQDIFAISRIDDHDPLENWDLHRQSFIHRVTLINSLNLEKLHYTSKNGTDLWVTLPKDSLFVGGSSILQNGKEIFCNIPTEEIFSAPLLNGVEGTLEAVMPLSFNGQLINNFGFVFKNGKVVDYHADQGKEVLDAIFKSGKGADRLGEIALVDKNSPIRKQNKIFYNTLFDENAACHFAFGQSYSETLKDGVFMSSEELESKGMNQSKIHVDFMVGADDLNIEGYTRDGKRIPIFENGSFAPAFHNKDGVEELK